MSSLTIDEKLHIIQNMRRQTTSLSQGFPVRSEAYTGPENHLYPAYAKEQTAFEYAEASPQSAGHRSFLKYRMFVCLIVFACFFALYKTNFEIKGYKVSKVHTLLEENQLPQKLQNSLQSISNQVISNLTGQ